MAARVHLVTGGYPRGATSGHDMDFARLRLLGALAEQPEVVTTTAGDFTDIGAWLDGARLLITYVAGPFPDDAENRAIRAWLDGGGRWFALHGTSGGKAARLPDRRGRTMVKTSHHDTLGGFFLNHPPLSRFEVTVHGDHPLTRDLPRSFEVADELYLVEMLGDNAVLLTTELQSDPSPPGFGFRYERDTALQPDGKTRVLGFTREVGRGGVAYVALGHCHSPLSNSQPFVDASITAQGATAQGATAQGATPQVFHGSWDVPAFEQILRNGIAWGIGAA